MDRDMRVYMCTYRGFESPMFLTMKKWPACALAQTTLVKQYGKGLSKEGCKLRQPYLGHVLPRYDPTY